MTDPFRDQNAAFLAHIATLEAENRELLEKLEALADEITKDAEKELRLKNLEHENAALRRELDAARGAVNQDAFMKRLQEENEEMRSELRGTKPELEELRSRAAREKVGAGAVGALNTLFGRER